MPRRLVATPFSAKVGARLYELRRDRGMTLAELADASHVSRGHLSNIEHGLVGITIDTIERVARALELPPLYLLTFAEEDERANLVEMARKLPPGEITKVARDMRKVIRGRTSLRKT